MREGGRKGGWGMELIVHHKPYPRPRYDIASLSPSLPPSLPLSLPVKMGVWLRHCKGAFKKHVFPRLCRPTKPAPPCPKAAAEEKEGGREDGLGGRGGRKLVACPPRTR